MHRLSGAVLAARAPADVTGALLLELRDALALSQVHLTEVSQGGEVGHATVAGGDGSQLPGYVVVLDERPSGVARVVASGAPFSGLCWLGTDDWLRRSTTEARSGRPGDRTKLMRSRHW